MTLSAAQQTLIEKPFAFNEHSFKHGQVYLLKSAIRRRLNDVDRDWREDKPELLTDTDPDVVSIALPLTVAGVTRVGVGVGIINRWITDEKTGEIVGEIEGFKLALEKSKARKSAATDALTRAFNEFNGGAYLKDKPSKIKQNDFADWLAKLTPTPAASHWAANGGLERVGKFMKNIGMKWETIADLIEPGRTLSGLSDTTLDEAAFMVELAKLAFKPAAPQTPPPAPTTPTQKPRYGESSATTSETAPALVTSVPPVSAAKAEDLNGWFPESSVTTTPSPDPLKNVYAGGAYNLRNTVREPGSPTGKKQAITSFRIRPADLGEGDIFRDGNGPITTILQVLPAPTGTCLFKVRESDLGGDITERELKLTASLSLLTISGGPKLDAVNLNPGLAPLSGSTGRLWVGEKKAQVAS